MHVGAMADIWLAQRFIMASRKQHTLYAPCQPIMWSRAMRCEAIHVNSYEFKTTPRTLIIPTQFPSLSHRLLKDQSVVCANLNH